MTAEEMWKEYARKVGIEHSDYEAWAFGDAADELAALTVEGKKTATSSADHDLVPGGKRHHSIIEKIQADLWELRDEGYKDFQAKLIPTVDPGTIIGVRIPQLRKYARKLARDPQIGEFLAQLPHSYYDENNLHAFVVEQIRDYEECLEQTRRFLPYVDNWATCDMMAPKVFGSHREALLTPICEWIASGKPIPSAMAWGC